MPPHSTWHEWNMNADDIPMTWFTSYVNLAMSHLALCRISVSKYSSGLACMQANSNLEKISTSHYWVLYTQNANENMTIMIPIAYLNENFMDCNENLAWGKQEPLIPPHVF